MIIKKKKLDLIVDEIAKAFARYVVFSIRHLYFSYDQFQLVTKSSNLTTMKSPLRLMRMCTLPEGATNSVAHMQSTINQILKEFISNFFFFVLDDISIKSYNKEAKDLTLDTNGYKRFVKIYIEDVKKILKKFKKVDLKLSIDTFKFGINEIVVVRHLCQRYGRKFKFEKFNAIAKMKICNSIIKIKIFLRVSIITFVFHTFLT